MCCNLRIFESWNCYMARVSIFLIAAALIAGTMGCDPEPTPLHNPEIRDWHDLHAIRYDLGQSYILMNDLDASSPGYAELASPTANQGKGWQAIGSSDNRFTGSFDGQGYEIRDLFIDRPEESFVGFFGAVGEGGVIQNVGVMDAAVTGEWAVGVLAGGNWGNISNSYSTGSVSGDDYVGGLAGGNAGSISNCYSTAGVAGRWDVGGLAGANDSGGTVSNSYSTGSVTGEWSVGGLVGGNLGGTVSRSYASASVIGDDYVGGLVGDNQGTVSNCYSTGIVTGQWYVGGLVGYNDSWGTVSKSYAIASVSGDLHAGGLVGENNGGAVSNSFWDISASGIGESDGGTGKTTTAVKDIATFADTATEGLNQPWDIATVAPGETNPAYTWNIVDGESHPFLSWQSVS